MGASLKDVRDRIKSVQNTQQMTKAMKMVAASKLRRAQDSILQLRPYADKLDEMMKHILTSLKGDVASKFGIEREIKSPCVFVVTSNRGLCGAFNTNIIKSAEANMLKKYPEQVKNGKICICCIGKKGNDYFKKQYGHCNIIEDYVDLFKDLSFDNVSLVAKRLLRGFEEEKYDVIDVSYGHFKNPGVQYPYTEQFLPVLKMEVEGHQHKADYIFEPDKKKLLENLIPSILQTQFHKYLLDTHASEHGARMTAMDQASENANEMLKELKVTYNKARQESITNEILEIVSGAAALEG